MILSLPRNATGRDLILGDVHGCFYKLSADLERIGFDPSRDRLFSVGDLVDRGPQSVDVIHWLDQPWFYAVRGNHEQMALEWYCGIGFGDHVYSANGGDWFRGLSEVDRMPYVERFAGLPLAIELDTEQGLVVLVHADITSPTWAGVKATLAGPASHAKQALIDNMLWGRGRIEASGHSFGPVSDVRAVVVGHTPVERFTSLENVFYVDSGAWLKGGAVRQRFCIIDAATLQPAALVPA